MLLQAAINGRRQRFEHPSVPITTLQLAEDVQAVVACGADTVHLHVRDLSGFESLHGDDVDRTVAVVRAAARERPIGISTGAWIEGDPRRRLERVKDWRRMPDYVSVNYHEHGSDDLARLFVSRGVAVEVGVWHANAAHRLAREGFGHRCLRVVIEPMEEEMEEALETVQEVEEILDAAGVRIPRLLHGAGATAWPLLEEAARRGHAGRIGLEDTLTLPDGSPAPDNASLVRAARQLVAAHGRV